VTLALDALLARGEAIQRVVVVHTNPSEEPIASSLNQLHREFQIDNYYRGQILYDPVTLTNTLGPLPDVATAEQVNAAFEAMYRTIRYHKLTGARLHLSIAGGRKTMALFAFSVAQFLFDADDHVWHLESDPPLRESRRLHAEPGDRVALIEVPLMQWSSLPGVVRSNQFGDTPQQAANRSLHLQQITGQHQVDAFLKKLSRAEKELLILLVQTGVSNDELAKRLFKSPKTIANQLNSIYRKFALHYQLSTKPDRGQVIATLSGKL
jgi:hypothetical protein